MFVRRAACIPAKLMHGLARAMTSAATCLRACCACAAERAWSVWLHLPGVLLLAPALLVITLLLSHWCESAPFFTHLMPLSLPLP